MLAPSAPMLFDAAYAMMMPLTRAPCAVAMMFMPVTLRLRHAVATFFHADARYAAAPGAAAVITLQMPPCQRAQRADAGAMPAVFRHADITLDFMPHAFAAMMPFFARCCCRAMLFSPRCRAAIQARRRCHAASAFTLMFFFDADTLRASMLLRHCRYLMFTAITPRRRCRLPLRHDAALACSLMPLIFHAMR